MLSPVTSITSSLHFSPELPYPTGKSQRKVYSYKSNRAASIDSTSTSIDSTSIRVDSIRQHAFTRIQVFYSTCLALYNKASRTDKDKRLSPSLRVGRTPVQVGKCSRGGKDQERLNASHPGTTGGLIDNLKPLIGNTILDERELTPKKLQLFNDIGIPDECIKELQGALQASQKDKSEEAQNQVASILKKIFDSYWSGNSILANTELEEQLNLTTALPRSLNRYVDGGLEKCVRPFVVTHLFKQCMKGDITSRVACKKFTISVRDHFDRKIDRLSKKIQQLKSFVESAEKLISIEEAYLDKEKQIKSFPEKTYKKILRGISTKWQILTKGLSEKSLKRVLPKTQRHIIRRGFTSPKHLEWLEKQKSLRTCSATPETLRSEWVKQIKFYEEQLSYCLEERGGTREPDYRYLTGTLSPSSGKLREASPQEEEAIGRKALRRKEEEVISHKRKRNLLNDFTIIEQNLITDKS